MGSAEDGRGLMEYSMPQRDKSFRSVIREHLKSRTQGLEDPAIEMVARALSMRDIEDPFKGENDPLLLSRIAISYEAQVGADRQFSKGVIHTKISSTPGT